MRRVRAGVAPLLLVSALALPMQVRADEAAVWSLDWSAPRGCPDERAVRATVATWLQRSGERNDPRNIHVQARVQRAADEFVLALLLQTSAGLTRERLTSQRCETLANVIALKVALASDPAAWFDETSSLERESNSTHVIAVRATAGFTSGVLPGVAPVLGLTASLRLSALAIEIGGTYGFPKRRVYYADQSEIAADLNLLSANARLCLLLHAGAVDVPLCAGADIGAVRGIGAQNATLRDLAQLYAAVALSPALRVPILDRFSLWLGGEALISFLRPVFTVRSDLSRWKPPMLGVRVQLGAELHFD